MRPKKILAAISFMVLAATAHAQTPQKARIRQGIRSGELTRHETRKVVKQEREIKQDVREAKADGVVTASERKEIRKDKRKASRSIYRKKHNLRDRS